MIIPRTALLFILPAALAIASPSSTPPVDRAIETSPTRIAWVYYSATTPLAEIPVYALAASAPHAMASIEAEIERLYAHSKTLPIGHDRRAFQTRIYLLEKQLRPLLKDFNETDWESLRSAVKTEWEAVQAALPTPPAPVVKDAAITPAARLASLEPDA